MLKKEGIHLMSKKMLSKMRTTLSNEATSFLLNCFTKVKENYDKFRK